MDRPGREMGRLQGEVMKRLDDFESKGWLTSKITEHYKKAIFKARTNPIKYKLYLEQMQKDLDRIKGENVDASSSSSPTSSTFSSGTSTSVSAFTEIASAVSSTASSVVLNKHQTQQQTSIPTRPDPKKANTMPPRIERNRKLGNDKTKPSESAQTLPKKAVPPVDTKMALLTRRAEHGEMPTKALEHSATAVTESSRVDKLAGQLRNISGSGLPLIVDAKDMEKYVGDDQIQQLFVEMCFFARLGYVQPPCCLKCTYREALKDANVQSQCQRWVVWRKDTTQLLHPQRLDGNLLFVQCRAGRRLLAGNTIDGHTWSAEKNSVSCDSS
jgi:hypothetical protein